MFTGIVELQGTVESLERSAAGGRLRVAAPEIAGALEISASIAVNGCCLTVVARDGAGFAADLSPETLARTTFGSLSGSIAPGTRVNLERPLTAGKELGGHFVQGHVDGVGGVTKLARIAGGGAGDGDNWWLEVEVPPEVRGYVAAKGSIAVDGISLTVASWDGGHAGFAVIPFTYAHTNVAAMRPGDAVNLEADILAKYVERLLDARRGAANSNLKVEKLIEQGF